MPLGFSEFSDTFLRVRVRVSAPWPSGLVGFVQFLQAYARVREASAPLTPTTIVCRSFRTGSTCQRRSKIDPLSPVEN